MGTFILREGLKKNMSFYPHFVDKGGGSADVDNFFSSHFIILL